MKRHIILIILVLSLTVYCNCDLLDLLNQENDEGKLIVLLRVLDYGYPPGFDFRCS